MIQRDQRPLEHMWSWGLLWAMRNVIWSRDIFLAETPLNNSRTVCPIRLSQAFSDKSSDRHQNWSGWLMHRKRRQRPEGGVTSRHSGHLRDVRSQFTTSLTHSFSLYIDVLSFCPPARVSKYSRVLIFLRLRTGPADQLSGLCGEGVRGGRSGKIEGRGNWYPRSCTWVSQKAQSKVTIRQSSTSLKKWFFFRFTHLLSFQACMTFFVL